MITFDEFTDVARKHLNMSKKEMPEERLGSLWCALDADDSNQLQRDEFARFLRLAAPAIHRGVYKRDKAKESTFGALRLGTALACTPEFELENYDLVSQPTALALVLQRGSDYTRHTKLPHSCSRRPPQ